MTYFSYQSTIDMVMEYWRPWFWGHTDKYVVKVTQLRLEFGAKVGAASDETAIKITGTATKKGKASSTSKTKSLLPFHRTQKPGSHPPPKIHQF
ncbi:hypothetical protein E2542_SST15193 [Spatholobus suberectus]|nr:hypothetical protein E2542_SST15193 [Spatholobus suberectus]